MAGVAVGYALSAATSFLVFASDSAEGSRSVMFWLLGSLNLAAWNGPLAAATIAVCLGIIALWVLSRSLHALAVGDNTVLSLGVALTVMRGGDFGDHVPTGGRSRRRGWLHRLFGTDGAPTCASNGSRRLWRVCRLLTPHSRISPHTDSGTPRRLY